MMESKSVAVPLAYARLLWGLASGPNVRLKNTAGMVVAYSILVIIADGVKCADPTSPAERFDKVVANDRVILKNAAQLPRIASDSEPDTRDVVIATATSLEAKTVTVRGNDDYLCRAGAQSFQDYFKKHGNEGVVERPPKPGEVGKQMVVPEDPSYVPQFLPKEKWLPLQEKARANFSTFLPNLFDKLATVP